MSKTFLLRERGRGSGAGGAGFNLKERKFQGTGITTEGHKYLGEKIVVDNACFFSSVALIG